MARKKAKQADKRRQISLRLVLIVPFVLQIVAAVGLVGYLSYTSSQQEVATLADELMTETSNRINQHLNSFLGKAQKINRSHLDAYESGVLNLSDFKALGKYFYRLANGHGFSYISFGNAQGAYIGAGFGENNQLEIAEIPAQEPNRLHIYPVDKAGDRYDFQFAIKDSQITSEAWYVDAIKAKKPVWSSIYTWGDLQNSISLSASTPVYGKDKQLIGVFGIDLELRQISDFLKTLNTHHSGHIFIMEQSGLMVASSEVDESPAPVVNNKATRLNALNSKVPLIRNVTEDLVQRFGSLRAITQPLLLRPALAEKPFVRVFPFHDKYGLDWQVVMVIPEAEFMAEIDANTRLTFLLCFFTLAVATGLGILTSNLIAAPIRRLSLASRAIASGKLSQVVDIKGIAELETLANSFNQMASELKDSFATLENRVQLRTNELAVAKEKAEVANLAKSTFIANMSHELRSPLNAVIGFSQVMMRTQNLPPEHYENLGIIHRSGEYLLTLINNVLDFSKIEAGKTTLNYKDFNFHQLLNDLEEMLHLHAFNAGLELIFDRGDYLPVYLHTDEVKLRQVLINLLGNAIKFTPAGEVVLVVRAKPQEKSLNVVLEFTVMDTGVGIAPDELAALFQAFSQTASGREAQEGTGLGLAISRQFVQLMGGDISVTSEEGKGTCFNFAIHAQLGKKIIDPVHVDKRQIIGLAANQPTYKLLVVDDKAINRQLLIKLLSPLGFEMREVSNGQEAIAICEHWQPNLIWMDMRMPVMDGYEATRIIKSTVKGQATAVIALTASVLEEDRAIVLSAGFDDFVRKPFREHLIFDILAKHLGVNYVYADSLVHSEDEYLSELTHKHFQIMPTEWLEKLSDAALEADSAQVLALIQEIPSAEVVLIKGLGKLVRQFQFELILNLIEGR